MPIPDCPAIRLFEPKCWAFLQLAYSTFECKYNEAEAALDNRRETRLLRCDGSFARAGSRHGGPFRLSMHSDITIQQSSGIPRCSLTWCGIFTARCAARGAVATVGTISGHEGGCAAWPEATTRPLGFRNSQSLITKIFMFPFCSKYSITALSHPTKRGVSRSSGNAG